MPYSATIMQQPPYGLIDLRADSQACAVLSQVLDCTLGQQANTVLSKDSLEILCLGPDQWLIKTEQVEQTIALLHTATTSHHAAITEVSDHYTVFRISGSDTQAVLGQACGIDLHPDKFTSGQCTRCAFARSTAILQVLDDNAGYDVYVESTYAHYMQLWFDNALGV